MASWSLATGTASATTTEPDGTVVPIVNAPEDATTVQVYGHHSTLGLLFSTRGEQIDSQVDAHTTPTIFSPHCDFTGTLVLHSAGCQMDFGWYNVDVNSASPPRDDQVFLLVPRDANPSNFPLVGDTGLSTFSSSDILSDPRYGGGLIGFAIKNSRQPNCPQAHYSEARLNPTCDDGTGHCPSATGVRPAAPWIMAVSYQSTVSANAYYLAFEDQPAGMNDGDFNDDVYFITGITCKGAGAPCSTGRPGACASGIQQCAKGGALTCVPTNVATAEVCDGVDNDCNGIVDDGSALCPAGQVCSRGACVTGCSGTTCVAGQVCTVDGVCGEPACQAVDCPDGQRCAAGTCAPPCAGVTCPLGQACRAGACVDACLGVRCDDGFVCIDGTCQQGCNCQACPTGMSCGDGGRCIVDACKDVTCAAGTTCDAGACVDNCAGAVCPTGETCLAGRCVDTCGAASCATDQKCVAGTCVDRCDGVTCATGLLCQAGICVDACSVTCGADMVCKQGVCTDPCANVTCAGGAACKWGACQDACVGVVCAATEKCVAGACVDACGDVTCAAGEACAAGVCHASCASAACPTDQKCVSASCVDACQDVACAAGTACSDGSCVDPCSLKTCLAGCVDGQCKDPCAGVTCPGGEICAGGTCLADPQTADGGITDAPADGSADAPSASHAAKSGCGCAVGPSDVNAAGTTIGLALALAALVWARRRHRR